jgi:hypothetical protein
MLKSGFETRPAVFLDSRVQDKCSKGAARQAAARRHVARHTGRTPAGNVIIAGKPSTRRHAPHTRAGNRFFEEASSY